MSLVAIQHVFENSKQTGSHLALLLAIADCANDHGDGKQACWPTVEQLAGKVNVSPRTVKRLVQHLVDSGELLVEF